MMSSLPHPEGVAEIIQLLGQVEALEAEEMELRPKVQAFAGRLLAVEEKLGEARRRLPELLQAMDVDSPGNFGWEKRMGWFLAEMRRQLRGNKEQP